jgi:Polyketide cyclase / dehydrase and lipid transport
MATRIITVSANLPVTPDRAYAVLADYLDGHPRILPSQFSNMSVEKGGIGAGTIVRFQMTALGRKQNFRAAITEPEPGRVLVETGIDEKRVVTTSIVDPGHHPNECHVTFTTELQVRDGLLGIIEGFLAERYLRPIYIDELDRLAGVAATYSPDAARAV